MTLEVISSSEILFKGDAESVTLPGVMGSFTVLKNHASLISVLKAGSIVYKRPGGEEISVDIKGGLVDVDNNVVSVCVY
ncbi:MAG: F0F1 ATP synthase subunit epsilon [Muribaculaceae bacterium]|nr:F0F1 ATP synthase subunit epsilon [Muribaculaceae bacterium]MDE5714068.1 F0F1 ATP synthase subunit epsilon [Muribaculaceae bacterium]